MNTVTSYSPSTRNWQEELAQGIRNVSELLKILHIPPNDLTGILNSQTEFPLRVPHSYVDRMVKGDMNDPLLRQVLPLVSEQQKITGFSLDPVGDLPAMSIPGLIHKYKGRVLLVVTGACAIHCRYCFRRHFPYSEAQPGLNEWRDAINYIENDLSITEVILSGGDPLSLNNQRLSSLTAKLAGIAHIKRLRIHTRLPVVLPSRVDNGFIDWINSIPFKTIMVMHTNHPNEINLEVRSILRKLAKTGTTLLNQTVLLHGVNNDSSTLIRLSETLFEANVIPYYLHLLDKVQGAAHFEVAEEEARKLHHEMLSTLPGYLVPRLVREQAGSPFKHPLMPS